MPRHSPRRPASWSVVVVVVVAVAVAVVSPSFAVAPAPGARPAPSKAQNAKPQPAGPNVAGLPTADELHQSFKDGNYKETLQKLSRVLALKGDAAKAYDRHDLLVLRAETQLKLKDTAGAIASFEQAAKEAPDDKSRALDVATQMVLRKSKNLTFSPTKKGAKAGDKGAQKAEPIDVSDPEKRKDAFAALLAEQKEEVAPKVKAAQNAKTLQPVIDALQAAGGMRTLELAATGEDGQVSTMVRDLSGRAQKMMADAVKDMGDTVKDIEQAANDLKEVRVPVRTPGIGGGVSAERSYKKRGLTTPDVKDLKRVIADCQKLVPAVKELIEKLGDSGEEFKQIGKDAVDVGTKAHEVLTTDYANSYTRSPRADRDRRRAP
jgi:hypothetical protein